MSVIKLYETDKKLCQELVRKKILWFDGGGYRPTDKGQTLFDEFLQNLANLG